jgi:hypothetical protein
MTSIKTKLGQGQLWSIHNMTQLFKGFLLMSMDKFVFKSKQTREGTAIRVKYFVNDILYMEYVLERTDARGKYFNIKTLHCEHNLIIAENIDCFRSYKNIVDIFRKEIILTAIENKFK